MHQEERTCWILAGFLGAGIGICWPWLWQATQKFPGWTAVGMTAGGGEIVMPVCSFILAALAFGRRSLAAPWAAGVAVLGTLYLTVLWVMPGALSWTGYVLYQQRSRLKGEKR
ncbi:hypothetical protein [Marinococcus halotolerans]|uniref:hypothetical protein n=1 Tax=Marinococcus halotolerans TaxID=301092 RepID=UPI0003B50F6E|nr:hypothetical protein [Marinococcus halotolerans]